MTAIPEVAFPEPMENSSQTLVSPKILPPTEFFTNNLTGAPDTPQSSQIAQELSYSQQDNTFKDSNIVSPPFIKQPIVATIYGNTNTTVPSSITTSANLSAVDQNVYFGSSHQNHIHSIKTATKERLWLAMKFIQSNHDLSFNLDLTSICGFLMMACHVPEDNEGCQRWWWTTYSRYIKPALTDCRNNCIKAMQKQFNGK